MTRATGQDKKLQEQLMKRGHIPQHIAMIMDGNGRWAKKRALPRVAGHHEGVNSVRDIVEACGQIGVKFLTLYTFSTENWKRPQDEVSILMRLLLSSLRDECDNLHKNNVRLKTIGDFSALPADVQDEFLDAIELTKNNTGLTLVLALSYSGRWDLKNAMKKIAEQVQTGTLEPEMITDDIISQNLATKSIPDPDLLVRTSGELRISNFLLWQLAYSEMYVTDILWPDFRRKQLYDAIEAFQNRERRFGLVSEQIESTSKKSSNKNYVRRLLKSVSGF
ncbi:MAG: isoprenyl transferase [Ignavibacteriales bacterium]|nr:isoprenyl transferase [Ignavibacteriales bacterium]